MSKNETKIIGNAREKIIDTYLEAVIVMYVNGRYHHCIHGTELRDQFIAEHPEF